MKNTGCETLTAARHKGQQKPPKMKIAKGGKTHSPFPDCSPQPDIITAADSADQGL